MSEFVTTPRRRRRESRALNQVTSRWLKPGMRQLPI